MILAALLGPHAAFLAMAAGEVDYVLNPLGLSKGVQELAERGEGVESYTNADYGMYYLAFNMRKYPMSEFEFRQAVDIITDKEFVANSVLGGVISPMYSTMPPGNAYWFNLEAENSPYIGLSRQERVDDLLSSFQHGVYLALQAAQALAAVVDRHVVGDILPRVE